MKTTGGWGPQKTFTLGGSGMHSLFARQADVGIVLNLDVNAMG